MLLPGVWLAAQTDEQSSVRAARRTAAFMARSGMEATPRASTAVVGAVWSADDEPISEIGVRLRNAVSGVVGVATMSNHDGEFFFDGLEPGTYVVEVTDGSSLVAVGESLSVAPGETVATFVKMPAPIAWYATDTLTSVGTSVVTSAAAAGVAGATTGARPVSRGQ